MFDDEKVLTKALGQHGLITAAQLEQLNVPRWAIEIRVRDHTWRRVQRGLYAIGGAPKTWDQRVTAAMLVLPTAVLSHESAAAWWNFDGYERGGRPVVTVPGTTHRSPSASVRRSRDLRTDIDVLHTSTAWRVTTPARTFVDIASMYRHRVAQLMAILDDGLVKRNVQLADLQEAFAHVATTRRRGLHVMGDVLARVAGGYVPTESELERRAIDVLERAGLPMPVRQHPLPGAPGRRVDLAYPDARLILELDGRTHLLAARRSDDALRDATAIAQGWVVVRADWELVTRRPAEFVRRVRNALTARLAS